MNEETKLLLAHIQVDNLLEIVKGNEYENFMCGKLYAVKYELLRQINNMGAKKGGRGGQLSEVSTID